ncbi:MAG TPA: efflux RND transporter periplasmic adaptor subunit [Opitutaceae bacterium]|nr:efflux RND transporter periplasmic adaptor subunit [Opitutaceae bacterium]
MRCWLVAALIPAALAGCGHREPSPPETHSVAQRVHVALVQRQLAPSLVEVPGTVRATPRATLAAKVMGSVVRVAALGQPVQAGEVLLTLSADELSARAARARAEVAQVERELARERGLLTAGAGTADAVNALEDRLHQAEAAQREADTLLGYAQVRAPFAGTVAARYVDAGDVAMPGAPLLQLDGGDALEIVVGVPESLGGALTTGAMLEVEIPGTASRFRAAIRELSSAAEATARTIAAKLTVPAGVNLRPGAFVRVRVPGAEMPTLSMPARAVAAVGQIERVFIADAGNRARLRLVRTGAARDGEVEILAGLDAGERVVADPPATLRDGDPLEIAP